MLCILLHKDRSCCPAQTLYLMLVPLKNRKVTLCDSPCIISTHENYEDRRQRLQSGYRCKILLSLREDVDIYGGHILVGQVRHEQQVLVKGSLTR